MGYCCNLAFAFLKRLGSSPCNIFINLALRYPVKLTYGFGLFKVDFIIRADSSTLELLKSLSGTISGNLLILLENDRKLFEQMIYNFESLPSDIDKLFFLISRFGGRFRILDLLVSLYENKKLIVKLTRKQHLLLFIWDGVLPSWVRPTSLTEEDYLYDLMVHWSNKKKEEYKKIGFIPIKELLNSDGSFKEDSDSEEEL